MSCSTWSVWRRRCLEQRLPLRWLAIGSATVSFIYLFYLYAVPQLVRFDFRGNLSWYDLGVYGFGPSRSYVSFEYESPLVEITQGDDGGCDSRYTFLAPHGDSVAQPGPMILDAQGELVWMKHNWETTHDFKVQRYRGEDYLTYWEGSQVEGRGLELTFSRLDSTYTPRYVINPVGNYPGDLHEFHLTADGTALATIYDPTLTDLSPIGGPEIGWIYDCLFQEIDIETGDLIFEWRASEHFPINSTYHALAEGAGKERASAFDFFHINSVDKDTQGNYIISARHFHIVSCISRHTGETLWTLGGKTNDFRDLSNGEATSFAWQHDARWHADSSTLTLFDNAAHSYSDPPSESRGMVIYLDIPKREATLRSAYYHPYHTKSVSQGNVQLLDDSGRVFVSWGHSAAYSEFSADGLLECNVHYGALAFFDFGRVVSYRAFKADWIGNPQSQPDAVVTGDVAHVSWNGATEVTTWRLETWKFDLNNSNIAELDLTEDTITLDECAKSGFETEISISAEIDSPIFRIAALDAKGKVLGVTDPLQRESEVSSVDELLDVHYWIVGIALVAGACGVIAALSRISGSCRCRRRGPWRRSEYQLVPLGERDGTGSR
ncbi:ASST-domain-containing protein [Aspergillus aurantiobrunneus]